VTRLIIRQARAEDAALLCAAEKEISRSPGLLVSQADELLSGAFASLIAALASGQGCYLVAEEDGRLVGHAFLQPMDLRAVCHVFRLTIVVHPGCSGRGIGTAMMNDLAEWARQAPAVQKVELMVRSTNDRARRLYEKFGFVEEGRFRNRIRLTDGSFIDDITMAWFPKEASAYVRGHAKSTAAPRGLLFDYGDTLAEEAGFDVRAGNEWLLSRASHRPPHVSIEEVLARADRVTREVAARRDRTHVETPWASLTRLIHEYFGIQFVAPMAELEMGFWRAAVQARPMPGARRALERFHEFGMPIGVVSNTCFGAPVIRCELEKHGLAQHLALVVVSADYCVRKPNPLLFEAAAARLGIPTEEIWFVGDRLDTDIAGAKAAGMTAVWFNPKATEDRARDADFTVTGWDDLVRLVSQERLPPNAKESAGSGL
jgi:HAD superfamily hydrolase (TIGR01662 family)